MLNDQSMMGDPNQMQQPMPNMGMDQPNMGMQQPQMAPPEPQDPDEMMKNYVDFALDQANLAKALKNKKNKETGGNLLDEIGQEVVRGYEADKESCKEWLDRNEEWLKLAMMVTEPKTYPWPKASNVKYPLLATAAMQYSARAYPALVPANGKVVKAKVIPYDPDGSIGEKAERIAKHMSYQVMYTIPGWEEDMDKLLMTQAISGICFKKTYHDKVLNRHCSHIVYPENFVVNYWAKSLEKAYRKTEILRFRENEVQEKIRADEEFLDVDLTIPSEIPEGVDKKTTTGTDAPPVDKSTPLVFLAQHTFWDIDGDGYEEPYIITVHKDTKKVVRITARWSSDGVYKNDSGEITRIIPTETFTAYPFIPNPDGSIYGIGFGILLGSLNHSVNSIINQLIDAGSLSNLQSGFLGKGLRLQAGVSPFKPGEWKVVPVLGDDLKNQIVPLPAKEPSNVLFTLLQMLITSGNQLASIAEIFVGKMPGQNTPATTTQETVKQGMAVFTAIYKRVYRSLDQEFKKIFRLNRISPSIVEDESKALGVSVISSDYEDDTIIIPGGDPTGDSESEKQSKIQQVGGMLQLGTINPLVFTEWALEAIEVPNYQKLIMQPQPQPDPKMETEKMKQQTMQQKSQLDGKAKQQEMQIKERMAAIEMASKEAEIRHKEALQAMELQGKQMENRMNMIMTAMENHFSAQKGALDIAHSKAKHDLALQQAREKKPSK